MGKKALFFDIDMTLWDRSCIIPEDTRWAIFRARELGHKAFICTGRSRGNIQYDRLLSVGWDGYVTGCGTLVECEGNTITDIELPTDEWIRIINETRRHKIRMILEGKDFLYLDNSEFQGDAYGDRLIKDLGTRRKTIKDEWGNWHAGKFSVNIDNNDPTEWLHFLEKDYNIIRHNAEVYEVVPKPYDKMTGIKTACDYFNIPVEDSVSFGDSMNDVKMLLGAGTGIAMGNCDDPARNAADMITDDWNKGGISNALKKLGIID